jgi:cephalosporin hydroxylase
MKKLKFLLLSLALFCASLHADVEEDELKKYVCEVLPTLEGWCSKEKALNFIDLILEVRPEVCVEIGVFGGSSLFPVALTLKSLECGIVYAIDPWSKVECIKQLDPIEEEVALRWWGRVNLQAIGRSYQEMLKAYELEGWVITFKTSAEKAAPQIDLIDILYLDANYSELGSLNQVKLYLPKVVSGGYIWVNDALSPKMQASLDHLSSACDRIKTIENGTCILFMKR